MKKFKLLFALSIASSAMVMLGARMATDKSKYNNDFVRIFPPHAADIRTILKIPSDKFHLAGLTTSNVFLQDRDGLLTIDLQTADTARTILEMPFRAEILIDSPYFFVHHGSEGFVRKRHLTNCAVDTTYNYTNGFTAFQPISPNKAILRSIDISNRKNYLTTSANTLTYTLQKQVDGLLCTDGLLQYSKTLDLLVYVYRYRNQFICFDTNLNVIRYGKTIDTTSVAKIDVAEIDGKIMMAKPPLSVNNDARVDGKYLFVQSNMVSKNEYPDDIKDKQVIDVYNIIDGTYAFSFYVQKNEGIKMDTFMVKDHTLVASFKDILTIYDLPSKYLP